jgi:cytochrome o ubiquinol oxidase subunit IV
MSAPAQPHGHPDTPHDHHADGMAHGHGTTRDYVIGFLLSVVLTAIPFALVMTKAFADPRVTAGIVMVFAFAQIIVHMIYFLHMNSKSENGWTMMALIFTVILVVIALTGTLWVMYHMTTNMMPPGMDMGGNMTMSAGDMGAM